jgi:hypothetical protein
MSPYNELEEINEDYHAYRPSIWTKEEIEDCVESTRLNLYNRDLPCGPKAIRKNLDEFDHVKPLPSERTIARILAKRCLTHRRTGYYEGDR